MRMPSHFQACAALHRPSCCSVPFANRTPCCTAACLLVGILHIGHLQIQLPAEGPPAWGGKQCSSVSIHP